jgi:hypothetical protein
MIHANEQRTEIPGFGAWLLAMFLTPVYCFKRQKWVPFGLSLALYIVSLLTLPLAGLGVLFWFMAVIPAGFDLRRAIFTAHAKRTGEEMAAAIAMKSQAV